MAAAAMSPRGQGGIELCLWVMAVTVALVALSHYVRFSMAGRVKSSADSLSPTLFNSAQADVAFLRCQNSVTLAQGAAGATQGRFASWAYDRTNLTDPVAPYAMSACPP
jgi:hypothetical protein